MLSLKPDYSGAFSDLVHGIAAAQIWLRLGWQEVKRRYRRTTFGPFWTTLGVGMYIGAYAFLLPRLFHVDMSQYLPYVATGMVAWTFVTALITEGCATYTAAVGLIQQLSFPFAVLNCMVIWRNIIVFFHNLVIVVIVVVLLKVPVTWNTLLLFPGLLIVSLNGMWITILLGMISTRFRDVPPLVGNLVSIMIFVTPVFFFITQLGPRSRHLMNLNLLLHLVEVLRAPMLGQVPPLISYEATIGSAVVGLIATFVIYARFRPRIAYWL
ncbi:MAG TPA: ABC transporter permease [Alphaproteobacteria bacterium]|nr:ABC transporter permease [Alphaproteobacteria bacterium]